MWPYSIQKSKNAIITDHTKNETRFSVTGSQLEKSNFSIAHRLKLYADNLYKHNMYGTEF